MKRAMARYLIDDELHLGWVDSSAANPSVNSIAVLSSLREISFAEQLEKWEQGLAHYDAEDTRIAVSVSASDVQLLPPVTRPGKIICIGRNYSEHAAEMGSSVGDIPVVFSKFSDCLIGHEQSVVLPTLSSQVDFEAELVVVIGKRGRKIAQSEALEHVFGYCCGNDISARDWQKGKPGGQWLLGKSFDTFAPLGPFLLPRTHVHHGELDIQLRLNGEIMQKANTSQLIFGIEYLVAHLSKFFTLEPGDLIFTGTPSGVGAGRTPPVYLKPGDVVEVEIDGLGVLRNRMVADS